jgi:CubicO group peptidase (beta-lactamase class C family)
MKKLALLLILFSIAIQLPLSGQKITTAAKPEDAGFSSERLKKLDAAMEDWLAKGWAPGFTALVIRNGKIAYYKSVGYDNMQLKTQLKSEAIYRIASQTKAITSVAIMMLFDEGKLLLDDPVSKYIPAFKKQVVLDKFNEADTTYTTVPAKKEVTIRELLTHTSGIGYAQIGSRESNAIYAKARLTSGVGVDNDTLLSAMNRLAALPLMHQPGERWTYGLNTDLLGALVEVISGMSLDDYFRTKIFQPLGMNDTYFQVPAQKAQRLVKLYKEEAGNKYVESMEMVLNNKVDGNYPLKPQNYFSGGAGLSSSIMDYGIFLQMLLNGGVYDGKRLLGSNTVRMMTTNQIRSIAFGGRDRFGLGFQLVTDSSAGQSPANAGTFSWGGAFATSYWVDPQEKMVLLFYRQLWGTTHGDVVGKFRALVYQALLD